MTQTKFYVTNFLNFNTKMSNTNEIMSMQVIIIVFIR